MKRLTAREKFDLVMLPRMGAGADRIVDGVFGATGLTILNDFEAANDFEITPPGSWTNQAGLEYIPLGLIGQDKEGYFFTGTTSDSVTWGLPKLPKGLTLKWIAKNLPSLSSIVREVSEAREIAHTSLEIHHYYRQPEFFSPSGFILGGVQKAHIIDASLLGGRTGETMVDVFLTTATAHTSHSFFSSDNFSTSQLSATEDVLGNVVIETNVTNPKFHHPDCVRKDTLLSSGMTPPHITGILKMFTLRKVLQQSRTTILEKWEAAHSKELKN